MSEMLQYKIIAESNIFRYYLKKWMYIIVYVTIFNLLLNDWLHDWVLYLLKNLKNVFY